MKKLIFLILLFSISLAIAEIPEECSDITEEQINDIIAYAPEIYDENQINIYTGKHACIYEQDFKLQYDMAQEGYSIISTQDGTARVMPKGEVMDKIIQQSEQYKSDPGVKYKGKGVSLLFVVGLGLLYFARKKK